MDGAQGVSEYGSTEKAITDLRSFVLRLPQLANYRFDRTINYLLWKTLNLALANENDAIDWNNISDTIESSRWAGHHYSRLLTNDLWKEILMTGLSSGDSIDTVYNSHQGASCLNIEADITKVYYCFTCTKYPGYEICDKCFDADAHVGHEYVSQIATKPDSKVCHCGDPAVFVTPENAFRCRFSNNNVKVSEQDSHYEQRAYNVFSIVMNHIVDWAQYYKAKYLDDNGKLKITNGSRHSEDICKPARSLTPNTFNISFEDSCTSSSGNTQDLISRGIQYNHNGKQLIMTLHLEDCKLQMSDLSSKLSTLLRKPKEFGIWLTTKLRSSAQRYVVLQVDDNQKIDELLSRFEDSGVVVRVTTVADLFEMTLQSELIEWLKYLCCNSRYPLKYKHMIRLSLLNPWETLEPENESFKNLQTKHMLKSEISFNYRSPSDRLKYHPRFHRWPLDSIVNDQIKQIMLNYNERLDTSESTASDQYLPIPYGSKFHYFLLDLPNILWTHNHESLSSIIASIFSLNDSGRYALAFQYLDVYLPMFLSFTQKDPYGIKLHLMSTIAPYVFHNTEICDRAIASDFLQTALCFVFAMLSYDPDEVVMNLPISLEANFSLPKPNIKNKKVVLVIKELCNVVYCSKDSFYLLNNPHIRYALLKCFYSFNDVLPLRRELTEHVEFENFDFSGYFHLFSGMLTLVNRYIMKLPALIDQKDRCNFANMLLNISAGCELFSHGHIEETLKSSPYSMDDHQLGQEQYFNNWFSVSVDDNKKSMYSLLKKNYRLINERIAGHTTKIIDFKVGIDTQNFFNPMSYLFRFVLQWSQCYLNDSDAEDVLDVNYLDNIFGNKMTYLHICDSALSTLVLLGQINVGLWVRNGSPIQHQAKMYTKFSMREFTYLSDISNVQFSMSQAQPDDFIVFYIMRWGLKHWTEGLPMGDYQDSETTVLVVEQCILLLIHLLTEIKTIGSSDFEESVSLSISQEIIHAVAYKSLNYSKIVNAIPEHIRRHPKFNYHFHKVLCKSSHGENCFSLRDKFKPYLNPYFISYSSSRIYEVTKAIRKNMELVNNMDYDDTYVPAVKISANTQTTKLHRIYAIASCDTFGKFLKATIEHLLNLEAESTIGHVLYLISLCLSNAVNDFTKVFWREYSVVDTEDCFYHSIGSLLYRCLLKEQFSEHHGTIRYLFKHMKETVPHVDVDSYLQEQTTSYNANVVWFPTRSRENKDEEFEKRKQQAIQRRDKILKKFARQQDLFIDNNLTTENSPKLTTKKGSTAKRDGDLSVWKHPEDICCLCKMIKDDDIFVYLSYCERNICDHGYDFLDMNHGMDIIALSETPQSNISKKTNTIAQRAGIVSEAPVIRICGHGAHIRCLSDYMDSSLKIQQQTTKNNPPSQGIGLTSCPVCKSLSNCFLPQMLHCNENQIEFSVDSSELLISTCLKSIMILTDLFGDNVKSFDLNISFKIIVELFTNTVRNLELRLRLVNRVSKPLRQNLPPRLLLTLNLLSELKSFIFRNGGKIQQSFGPLFGMGMNYNNRDIFHLNYSNFEEWEEFLESRNGDNMLSEASLAFDSILEADLREDTQVKNKSVSDPCQSQISMSYHNTDIFKQRDSLQCMLSDHIRRNMMMVAKKKLHQDLLLLTRELLRVNYYEDLIASWIPSIDQIRKSKEPGQSYLDHHINEDTLRNMIPVCRSYALKFADVDEIDRKLEYWVCAIYKLLRSSFEVFLRRVSLIFHVHFPMTTNEQNFDKTSYDSELSELTHYLCLPEFKCIVDEFVQDEYFSNNVLLDKHIVMSQMKAIPFFGTSRPFQLIRLPRYFSEFQEVLRGIRLSAIKRDELAICLFCGELCHVQRVTPETGYLHGECTYHSRNKCPVTKVYGLFLLLRTNIVYISYDWRGTFYPSPYVNEFGEHDEELKYNSPMVLREQEYDDFCSNVVLGSLLPHVIYRMTDGNSDLGGWETM